MPAAGTRQQLAASCEVLRQATSKGRRNVIREALHSVCLDVGDELVVLARHNTNRLGDFHALGTPIIAVDCGPGRNFSLQCLNPCFAEPGSAHGVEAQDGISAGDGSLVQDAEDTDETDEAGEALNEEPAGAQSGSETAVSAMASEQEAKNHQAMTTAVRRFARELMSWRGSARQMLEVVTIRTTPVHDELPMFISCSVYSDDRRAAICLTVFHVRSPHVQDGLPAVQKQQIQARRMLRGMGHQLSSSLVVYYLEHACKAQVD